MRNKILWTAVVGLALLAWSSRLDVDIDFDAGPPAAEALDLFGSDDDAPKSAQREAFWRSESGIPTAQPIGIPTSFADLAERVAPAVVSIQTRATVTTRGPGLPPGLEEFFGGRPWHHPGDPRPRKSSGASPWRNATRRPKHLSHRRRRRPPCESRPWRT